MDGEKYYKGIVCRDVKEVHKESHWSSAGLPNAGIGSQKFVQVVHRAFCTIIFENHRRLFVVALITHFSRVMLS
jgi:hypothetical protein